MDWIQRRPKIAAASGVAAVVVALVLVWLMVRDTDKPAADPGIAVGLPSPSAEPTLGDLPTPTALPSSAQDALESLGRGLSGADQDVRFPGLPGGSYTSGLPRHVITLTATSTAPIGTVGYIIPTSLRDSRGVVRDVQRSWSLTTTVYGDPDYARLFIQSGPRGFPITCTITVDGKVTEKITREGPYTRMMCQG